MPTTAHDDLKAFENSKDDLDVKCFFRENQLMVNMQKITRLENIIASANVTCIEYDY